jgi:hypothetical protein
MTWDEERPEETPAPTFDDEPAPAWRDRAPDILTPIDETSPVSGHHPPAEARVSWSEAPEHDWAAASSRIMPILRPAGSAGTALGDLDQAKLAVEGTKRHALPVIDPGPVGLEIGYVIREASFDVLVNADHLLAWGIEPAVLRSTAIENLGLWSAVAPWTDELSGERRLLSSDTGEGGDAARILLPEVRKHLADELGNGSRVMVGVPDRDLLVAGTLRPEDDEFATLFSDFVLEHSGGADEPIDRRVFELIDGELTPFVA